MKKIFYTLMFAMMIICNGTFAQKKEIIVVTTAANNYDSTMIDAINAYGGGTVFNVTVNTGPSTNGQITSDMKATLSAADVVIMGRAINSNQLTPAKTVWDSITAPVLALQHWAFRSDRLNWINTPNSSANITTNADTILKAVILQSADPAFTDLSLADNQEVDWWTSRFSILPVEATCNCTVLAKSTDNKPLFIRWAANADYYAGAAHQPLAERVYISNGQDNTAPHTYFNFSETSKKVFFNELARLAGLPLGIELTKNKASQLSISVYAGNIAVSSTDFMSHVEVFSISGKLIVSKEVKSKYANINTSLADGIYIVRAYNLKGLATTKKVLVRK